MDARIVVGIDLAEPLELRLRYDHLAGNCSRSIQHRLSLLLDIKRVVLAGKLRELVGGIIQVLFRDLEALLEKLAFTVRGRSGQFGNKRIQLVYIGAREGRSPLWSVIRHADADNAALLIL